MNMPAFSTQHLSAKELEDAIGIQLLRFFNVLCGSPDTAAAELLGAPLDSKPTRMNPTKPNGLRMLQILIEKYHIISFRAAWKGESILASALAVQSWIDNGGDVVDELLMLLGVHKLLSSTQAFLDDTELEVLMLGQMVDIALSAYGIL